MRESGLWHAELLALVVSLRHTETIVVADAGLPVPDGTPVIDLGWRRGEPRLLPLLRTMLEELVVERALIAVEASEDGFVAPVCELLPGVPVERITHDQLKAACGAARAVIRTGEATPYANVVLQAGVPFGAADAAEPAVNGARAVAR